MQRTTALVLSTFAAIVLQSGFALAATTPPLPPSPLVSCGQTVSNAVLVADLDCTAETDFAVTVEDKGTLDLAGYRLTGTAYYGTTWQDPRTGGGVYCLGSCTIIGGGGVIAAPADCPARPGTPSACIPIPTSSMDSSPSPASPSRGGHSWESRE